MVATRMRFTFARPGGDPRETADVIAAALQMAEWGDGRGIDRIALDEHHVTDHSWSANPILGAAAFLARTERIRVAVSCAIGPLWEPIRLAEDIAFVDQMSRGRLDVVFGLGYRSIEYAALGQDFASRGARADHVLDVVLKAWSGEAFEHNGEMIRVTPIPLTRPHPPVEVGGAVRAAARRAVRFGLPLHVPRWAPDLEAYYRELCAEAGQEPRIRMASVDDLPAVFVHEDPDRAWATLGEAFRWEAALYGTWSPAVSGSVMHVPGVETVEDVRASGRYLILSPDELVERLRARGDAASVSLYPLCGNMPIDEGWRSLHLLTDVVLPRLADPDDTP